METQSFLFGQFMDAFLRIAPRCAEAFGGDFTRMLVFYAAARASVAHLNHHNIMRADAEAGAFPDEMRRPVSMLSLAEHLGLPRETVRRHMHALVETGWCERVGSKGFLVRRSTMQSHAVRDCAAFASGSIVVMHRRFLTQGIL